MLRDRHSSDRILPHISPFGALFRRSHRTTMSSGRDRPAERELLRRVSLIAG